MIGILGLPSLAVSARCKSYLPKRAYLMNLIQSNVKTMSSREIAELTGSRHDAVRKSARRLEADQILTSPLAESVFYHKGNAYQEFHFNKRDSLVLVARLSPEFTAAVVDRWQELESQQAPKPMTQLEMIAGMARSMVEVERKQVEQAKALEDITSKVARLETSDKVLSSCPVNAEGITSICARMNIKYSIPAWAVKEIVRGSYGIRPAGNVQNQHESAKGSTYVVWWVSDITALFKRIAGESERVTATLVTHPTVSKRFKLI